MKTRSILLLVVIVGLVGFWIYQDWYKTQPISSKPLVIIHQGSWFGDAPFYLAQEKGFFEKHGVKVEIKNVEEAQARRQLLASGQADISAETIDMAVVDVGAGVNEKIFMGLDFSLGADGIVATSEIKNITDLKGKKVGAVRGDPPYFLLRYLMKEKGMSINDIVFQDMPNVDAIGAAFLSGQIDAAGTWEPWLSRAGERKGGHILISSKDAPEVIVDVGVVRPEILKQRPEEVRAVMEAWWDAVDYWKEHPQEANEIMAKEYSMSAGDFADLEKQIQWSDQAITTDYFGKSLQKGKIFQVTQTIIDIAKEDGMIHEAFEPEQIIDLTTLER